MTRPERLFPMMRALLLATLSLVLGVTLGVGVLGSPATAVVADEPAYKLPKYQPWGATRAPDQRLRRGCHSYRYHYRVNPPSNDWTAEVFLVDPTGDTLTSTVFAPESDPASATRYWRICRANTRPGRFKMRMRVVWYERYDSHVGWVKPSYFRLYRRR